ncbi:MAG: hypothetical protein HY965_07875 [Ignavibacteriales bacterium]|nr:hypothetical protein [Ignavibacteriales bacterium]
MRLTIIIILLCGVTVFSQYQDSGKRGMYFAKKQFSGAVLPTYKAVKDKLPIPVLDANKDYIDLYWRAWELACTHFKNPPEGSPFVSDYIDEAFSPSVFQWDTVFMLMFARYAHFAFPAIQSLDNFYCRQYESGYICREIQEADGADYVYEGRDNTINPPLFGWAELENARVSGDKSRYALVIPALEKYAEWLEQYRVKPGTKHGLYWQTGLGSGMDNSPRQGSAWIDMSAQMVMFYYNMAEMSRELQLTGKEEYFIKRAGEIAAKINLLMWNETDGMYYDLDDTGKQIPCKTIAGFWPLIAGIANQHQAERLYENLKDPRTFWRTIPFPSLAADHPAYKPDGQYWLGSVWAPTNVMVIKGLEKYNLFGFDEFASLAAETYLDGMYKVYIKTGTIWENYAPDAYSRGAWSKPHFVGWSGCGPIQLLLETIIGIKPDGIANTVQWNIHRIDRHGIQQLRFGEATASLICDARRDVTESLHINVTSDKAFTLVVYKKFDEKKEFAIKKGRNDIRF